MATPIAQLDVEPGTLPATMAAWVIREERYGEPLEAFQLEEMEVPEPGAFEVIVRVMAAGVNYNNVWAALGKPVSVLRGRDEDHHIGGSDASGIVWKVGEGVTRWKPGDEVVLHCNQASYEDVEVHGLDPLAAPSQRIWGYETTWGSFAQFCKVQAQQCLPKPKHLSWEEAASYALTYFTAYRMLIDQAKIQAGHRVLVWGAAGGLGVFALQLCRLVGADTRRRWSPRPTRASCARRSAPTHVIDRGEFAGMMRRGGETPEEEAARAKESRRFAKHVAALLGAPPDVVFEHVGKATFPTSVLDGQAVRQGRDLRGDLRLPARLRRPLPLDAPEADHRQPLRERLRGDEGERADRIRQDPSRVVEDHALRRRRRGAPVDVQKRAPGQDRHPCGRRGRGPRAHR